MRFIVIALVLALGACAGADPNSLVGIMSVDARKQMDDEKCQEFGYRKGSDGYAKCRLELERQRAVAQTGTRVNF